MGKPTTAARKLSIKGTRDGDVISVLPGGYELNGTFKSVDPAVIQAGVVVDGSAGNDRITGGTGLDTLKGGDGDDVLIDHWLGAFFDGGRGSNDLLDLSGNTEDIVLDLKGQVATTYTGHIQDDDGRISITISQSENRITGIEHVTGGSGNDVLFGNNAGNEIHGGAGWDLLSGGDLNQPGADKLYGEDGNDQLAGGLGNDELWGGAGSDLFGFNPNDGNDIIWDFERGVDKVSVGVANGITWSEVSFNGTPTLQGSAYDGSTTFILAGLTMADVDMVQVVYPL